MSYPVSRREQVLSIPALSPSTFPLGGVDFIYFHTVPDGVAVKLNGESESSFLQGETHQGEPGSAAIQSVTFINQTAGALAVRIVFGLGKMTVAGVATLSGAIPLPSGASTAALQTTQTTRLNLLATEATLAASATAAKQDTQTTRLNLLATEATLAALTAANTDTAKIVNLGASSGFTYTGCKSFSLLNTGAGNVVITVAGIAGNLPAGYGVDFPLSKPLNLLAPILVTTGAGGAALISLTQ
jgi:hypothetical protein